jgi:hypothetical protein
MNSLNRTSKQEYTPPTQDQIALRAHQLWVEEGCPQGHDVENWLEAERQLSEDFANPSSDPLTRDPLAQDRVTNRDKINKDPRQIDLTPAREDVPFSAFDDDAPLATKVEEQLIDPGTPASRRSKTSLEVDTP